MKILKDLAYHQMVSGLPSISEIRKCKAYSLVKQTYAKFPAGMFKRATTPLELLYGDVVGLVKTTSIGGNLYFLLLTNDFSRHS